MTPLDLVDVCVRIGARDIVRGVTAFFAPGQLVALIGPNGAGKTTLLRAIAGLGPYTGTIRLGDILLDRLAIAERAKRIGYLPQGHQVHWPMSARDIVALGRYPHGGRDPVRLSVRDDAIVSDAMRRADCEALADANVQTLSGGERARIMVARALAVQAPILLADEPTAALDPRHQLIIMAALQAEARRGALVVTVTHDIMLAARFSDRVLVMHRGEVVADGAPSSVLTEQLMRDVYRVSGLPIAAEGQTVVLPWGLA